MTWKSLHTSLQEKPPRPDMRPREAMDVEKRVVRFDSQAAQPPGHKSAGVDVDAVGMKFHVHDRVMSVHNNLSKSLFAVEKFVPNPEQVLIGLLRQRHAGPHAGMDKEEVPATE